MPLTPPPPPFSLETLRQILRDLRDPVDGCPWDLEQDFASIAPYTIEEAYEVAEAIEHGAETGDFFALKDELGDLLLQIAFHARMAEEKGLFAFADVVDAICAKMVRRHPHVFGGTDAKTAAEVGRNWDDIKRRERAAKSAGAGGLLDDVPRALPALMRAVKLQNRAAQVGFDWPNARYVIDKIAEEARELEEARQTQDPARTEEEFGDLLFAVANLARHLKLDPETALRAANAKFVRRFKAIEAGLRARGKTPEQSSLEEMEALWQEAKQAEKP